MRDSYGGGLWKWWTTHCIFDKGAVICFEHVIGSDLRQCIQGGITEADKSWMCADLRTMHDALVGVGVVHGDISPRISGKR